MACTPASIASKTFAGAASGVVKSTITSAPSSTSFTAVSNAGSARPTSSMSSAASTAPQVVSPMRPAAPETTTLIGSAIGGDLMDLQPRSLSGGQRFADRGQRGPEAILVRGDRGGRQGVG